MRNRGKTVATTTTATILTVAATTTAAATTKQQILQILEHTTRMFETMQQKQI